MPIKLELITKPEGNKNGTRIYWYPIEVEIDGKVVTHNLVYFKGGEMRQGFTDSVFNIGNKAGHRVWGIVTSLAKAVKAKFHAERLTDDERRGQYAEAVEKIADEITAALTSGEISTANDAVRRAVYASEVSFYSGTLALDTVMFTARRQTLRRLAQKLILNDVLEALSTSPAYVQARTLADG